MKYEFLKSQQSFQVQRSLD